MDSFMQMNEHRDDEMEELVCQPAWEASEINTSYPIQSVPLLTERGLEAAELGGRVNADQIVRAERYRSRMDLRPALIRGRGLATRCAKARSQKGMGKRRQNISEYYGFESGLRGKRRLPRRISLGKFMKEEAERIKEEERRKAEKLMREFRRTEFSTKVLETDYVMANLDECLEKIELIRRVKDLESRVSSEAFDSVKQKLEAVEEYANVVYRAWLEKQLEIVELDGDDKENTWRRLAYLENSMLRFYLDMRRFKSIQKNNGEVPNEYREDPGKTRVEASLSVLEAKLHLSGFIRKNARIMRSFERSAIEPGSAGQGEVIRASEADAQGKMEHQRVKERFFAIYRGLKSRLKNKLGISEEAFAYLDRLVMNYVYRNRNPYENRREAEETESKALTELKNALADIRKNRNKCGKYAAILLGLLTEESSGYLEVPSDGVRVHREDTDIICRKQQCEYEDCTGMPLFTHRPNIKDIEQGVLADCYLLAGLTSVVDQNPEEIMNIMRDNGDGTVTVCFKLEEQGENGGTVFTPCYVTVRKTIPVSRDTLSKGAFWVKMMEKAYAASGIHLLRKINENRIGNRQAPQKYGDFLIWLRDEKKRVDYDEIERGGAGPIYKFAVRKRNGIL